MDKNTDNNKIIGIGWDVGGWFGDKNGFAFVQKDYKENISILEQPYIIKRKKNINKNIAELIIEEINQICKTYKDCKIILAIDAPLGFPIRFKDFINNIVFPLNQPAKYKEFDLAYRQTEKELNKRPFSPSFDSLTNNTTLAISVMRKLIKKSYGFKCFPFDNIIKEKDNRVIIEVYPGILTSDKLKNTHILEKFDEYISKFDCNYKEEILKSFREYYLPDEGKKRTNKTNECDAVICSLLAVEFGLNNYYCDIPAKYKEISKEEGWIYYPEELNT